MKKLMTLLSLITISVMITSCSSGVKRDVASDPCQKKYFVDEYSHFENYETCNDY